MAAEQRIQVLTRAFSVIECMGEHQHGIGVTELSQKVGLSKTTTFRIVNALLDLGYVQKDESMERYKLSLKFLQLSSMLLNQTELKVVAYPHMKRLATRTLQAVHLCVLRGSEAMYLDKVEAYSSSIRMYSAIGSTVPLYCSAVGKVLMAWLPEESRRPILAQLTFGPRSVNTIRTLEDYLKELELTCRCGYAIDNLENEDGICCTAAPLRDFTGKVVAAISVSGRFVSIESTEFQEAVDGVVETAGLISKELGYMPSAKEK